jgi:hypothetical protein
MTEALATGGVFAYAALAIGALGLLVNLGMAGLAFTKRRVWLTAIVALPMLSLLVAGIGYYAGGSAVLSAVEGASSADIWSKSWIGYYEASGADVAARWMAAAAFVAGAWAAAVGSLVPGDEGKLTPVSAGAALVTTLIGAGVCAWWTSAYGGSYAVIGVLVASGLGVTLAATRRASDEQMFRVAGMRFTSGVSALFAVWNAGRAADLSNHYAQFTGPMATITDINKAMELYDTQVNPVLAMSLIAAAFAFVVAAIGCFSELGEVIERETMFDLLGVASLMIITAVVRSIGGGSVAGVFALATNPEAYEIYRNVQNGLPQSTLAVGETLHVVPAARAGYGDIYERQPIGGGEYGWFRTFAWNGAGWSHDHTPLEEAAFEGPPPLIVIEGSLQAKHMLPVLEKSGGKGFLLTRASEAKAGIIIPPEVSRLSTAMFPVTLSETRDLKTELWQEAGSLELMWGPVVFFGEGDDAEPVPYVGAVQKASAATGLNVSIGERRVNDVIQSCLPFMHDFSADGGFTPTDRWCHLTTAPMTDLRKEASGVWDIPAPATVAQKLEFVGPFDQAEVADRLSRELGAVAYCYEKAVKGAMPTDVVEGEMIVSLVVTKEGVVADTRLDEKSKVMLPAMLGCVNKRYRGTSFTLPPEVPPAPVPEGQTPPPPPPPPSVKVTFALTKPADAAAPPQ